MANSRAVHFFDAQRVRDLLDYPGCIATIRAAMAAFSSEEDRQPLRTIIPLAEGKLFALMPGIAPGLETFGGKLVSAFTDPRNSGRSAHRGVVVLFEPEAGEVIAIADAGEITHIRTAAASAVATDALARENAKVLTVLGYGAQAESHIRAIILVRPIERILVWGRDPAAGGAFVDRMKAETGIPVAFTQDAQAAASAADIVCTTTGSSSPVLFGDWLRAGVHVNLVGSSHAGAAEADDAVVAKSRYIVDSRRSALAAAAEFLNARAAGLVDERHIAGEIGEVLLGRVAGRRNAGEITVYKSLGHVVQDLAAAAHIYRCANQADTTAGSLT